MQFKMIVNFDVRLWLCKLNGCSVFVTNFQHILLQKSGLNVSIMCTYIGTGLHYAYINIRTHTSGIAKEQPERQIWPWYKAFDTKKEFPILSIFICKICMYTGMQGRVTETVGTFNPCDKWSHNINIHDLNIEKYTINLKFNMWRNSHHKLSE